MCLYTNDSFSITFHRQIIVVPCSCNGMFCILLFFCIYLEKCESSKGKASLVLT